MRARLSALLRTLHGGLVSLWLLPIFLYRRFFSGLKPLPSCRFRPTCSAYAVEAVREWGILIGTVLAGFRVLRCNPFSRGGYDPVPRRAEVLARLRARLQGKKAPAPKKHPPE